LGRVSAVFASTNPGKLRELRALLPDWEIEPLSEALPDETGTSFYENARAKALFAAECRPGRWALGEDSGLEVDGLGGRPGIRSARYAGAGAGDEDNVRKLLAETAGFDRENRRARYVSELVGVSPAGAEHRGRGTLEGAIAEAPRGTGGFGYDPVFVPEGETRTVAELGDPWKRGHSHRARAVRALLGQLGEVAP
jgi:XTP/dITP diphosphohydrolase